MVDEVLDGALVANQLIYHVLIIPDLVHLERVAYVLLVPKQDEIMDVEDLVVDQRE